MNDDFLQQAIALAQARKKEQALPLLQQVLMENPKNEIAWLWLADCLPTIEQRIEALETFVQTVPEAKRAQAGLAALRKTRSQQPAAKEQPAAAEQAKPLQRPVPSRPEPPAYQPPAVPQDKALPVFHLPVISSRQEAPPLKSPGSLPPDAHPSVAEEPAKEDPLSFDETLFKPDNAAWSFDFNQEEPAPAADEASTDAEAAPEEDLLQNAPWLAEQKNPEPPPENNDRPDSFYDTGMQVNPAPPGDQPGARSSGKDQAGDTDLYQVPTEEEDYPPEGDASPDSSSFTPPAEANEWPMLRKQVQEEAWILDGTTEAGMGPSFDGVYDEINIDALLSETNPDPADRIDPADRLDPGNQNAPEMPPPVKVSAFTVPIENISQEEFSRIEERTQAVLENKPLIRPLKAQQNRESAQAAKAKQAPPKKKSSTTRLVIFLIIVVIGLLGVSALLIGLLLRGGF